MKSIDNALIKATEDYIRQLIGQMRSNPSPELLLALRAVLGISGIDKNLIEEAERVIQEAGQTLSKASMATLSTIEGLGLDAKQMKRVAEFYTSLDNFKQDAAKYSEALAEFERETQKKDKELEALISIIAADPMSQRAEEARVTRNEVILEMIRLYEPLSGHDAVCAQRLEQCNAKRVEIEKDETLTDRQRDALKGIAERELSEVEKMLEDIRGDVGKYDEKLVTRLGEALQDQIAAKRSATNKGEYKQTPLLDDDMREVADFIQRMKVAPKERIHDEYDKFTEGFVKERVVDLKIAPVKEETKTEAAEQQGRPRRSKYSIGAVAGINTALPDNEEVAKKEPKSFVEKELDREAERHSKGPQNTR